MPNDLIPIGKIIKPYGIKGQIKFKFYNDTGATSDNTYRGFTLSESGAGAQNQSFHNAYPFLSVNQSNSGNAGMSGYMWVFNPVTSSTETAFTFSTACERHDGYSGVNMGSGVTTDHGSRTHTGFYWFTSQGNFAERAKVAVVEKTIGTVTPDKSTVMFKIFCTDEAALHKFIEGTEVSKPIMDEVLDSYSIYDLTKVK